MQLAEFIKSAKIVLLITGIWPEKNPTVVFRIKTCITLALSVLLLICMFINVGYNCGNFITLSKSLYLTMAILCGVTKEVAMVFKGDQFNKILDMFNTLSFTRFLNFYTTDLKDYLKILGRITLFFRVQVIGCLIGMTLFPVMEQQPLPIEFPFFNNGTYHYPFYTFQMVSVSIVAYHNMTVDLLITGVFAIAAVQLKILNKKLREMTINVGKMRGYSNNTREAFNFNYLKECCIHYGDIEKFIKKTVRVFSGIFIVQLGACSLAICNAGIIILTISPMSIEAISLYFYLVAMFLQLGLYCWFGNDIYFESGEINTACYMSKWYENGPKVRKVLFILMERTKRPMEIKGVGFVTLSFRTFIGILKWSYSYFTLLRNFTDKEGHSMEM